MRSPKPLSSIKRNAPATPTSPSAHPPPTPSSHTWNASASNKTHRTLHSTTSTSASGRRGKTSTRRKRPATRPRLRRKRQTMTRLSPRIWRPRRAKNGRRPTRRCQKGRRLRAAATRWQRTPAAKNLAARPGPRVRSCITAANGETRSKPRCQSQLRPRTCTRLCAPSSKSWAPRPSLRS